MTTTPSPGPAGADHWDRVYDTDGAHSWQQPTARESLALITELGPSASAAVIDVGGGDSPLAGELVADGYTDVTVVDISTAALQTAQHTNPDRHISWITADVLNWRPHRRWDLWHDRALFHFLTDPADRARYQQVLAAATHPNSRILVGTFAADGPNACSGLPTSRYSPETLAAEFDDGFDTIATQRVIHTTSTGINQPFTWITLRPVT